MGITIANKTITPASMKCYQTGQITLALSASGSIETNPVDIMLALDRSGSMAGTKIDLLKEAANSFVQIIANASNNLTVPPDSDATEIANSKIGAVSFSSDADAALPLSQTVATIQAYINPLTASGNTNHKAAFEAAALELQASTNPKYIIMITDGNSTAGGSGSQSDVEAANAAAKAARDAGIIIYCIGLGADVTVSNLNTWSSGDPNDSTRVLNAPTEQDLKNAFEALAKNLTNTAPEEIEVVDTLTDDFEIMGPIIPIAPAGIVPGYTVSADRKTITWTLSALGTTGTQSASLLFNIRYVGTVNGTFEVNESITYKDKLNPDPATSTVNWNIPITEITLECDTLVIPGCKNPCVTSPVPCCGGVIDLLLPSNESSYEVLCNGAFLNLYIRLKDICPNRQLAVGVVVCEDVNGIEQPIAYRMAAIVSPEASTVDTCGCIDFTVPMQVLLPDRQQPTGTSCATRTVKIQVIVHYISTNISICHHCSELY